ncbi:MAG TPA: FtsQ-type POTRA domain-containing protein [Gaiellaceae bacterium]|nr:FtsQ-type POTRA domain-containing protein [Gaiellaceae bacterium]
MGSRPHLSLVPANGLPLRLRRPSARTAAVAGAVAALLGLLYLAARETSLFAVRELEVSGAPRGVRAAVVDAASPYLGESLVALDRDELRRRLAALPTVREVHVDRAFPHALRIAVVPERPLAVVRRGQESWLVSARGRVLRPVGETEASRRPRISAEEGAPLVVGGLAEADGVSLALEALRRLPASFPVPVDEVRTDEEQVTFVLGSGAELRLGGRDELALKLAVAGRVLRELPAAERDALAYLDVTVPERPVGSAEAQLSG